MTDETTVELLDELDGIDADSSLKRPLTYSQDSSALWGADGDFSGLAWLSCCNLDDESMLSLAAIYNAYPRLRAIIEEQGEQLASISRALRYETDVANQAIDDARTAGDELTASQAREAALREALEDLLGFTEGMDGEVYGPFCGGDPRLFHPDEDDCSQEEIARWRVACEEWDEGRGEDRGPGCATMGDGSAWTGSGFGLGTTTIRVSEIDAARKALAAQPAPVDLEVQS